jgi:CheY-like chemotaxis protein
MTLVLLAEDDPELVEKYYPDLERAGYRVLHVDNADSMLSALRQSINDPKSGLGTIEIIVSDTILNESNGHEACKEYLGMGEQAQKTLIIGMSSASNNDKKWERIAHEFLCKVEITGLGKTVRAIHDRYLAGYITKRLKEF